MKKTIVFGLMIVSLALLGGCHTYDQAYVPADYYGSYGYPAYSASNYPYYYPYPYYTNDPYYYGYPAYYSYPAYPYPAYYPYYYPYYGFGFGYSTVIIGGSGCCSNSGRVFRGSGGGGGGGGRGFRR